MNSHVIQKQKVYHSINIEVTKYHQTWSKRYLGIISWGCNIFIHDKGCCYCNCWHQNRVRIGREHNLEKYKYINTNVCPKVLPQTTFKEKNKIITSKIEDALIMSLLPSEFALCIGIKWSMIDKLLTFSQLTIAVFSPIILTKTWY